MPMGAAEGSEEAGGGVSAKPGGSEGGIVELWPFAFTVNYWMNLLTEIEGPQGAGSGHPHPVSPPRPLVGRPRVGA